MITTLLIASLALLVLLVIGKAAAALLGQRPDLRNDDDPFKVGSTAWFRHGPGSDRWKEHHGDREP